MKWNKCVCVCEIETEKGRENNTTVTGGMRNKEGERQDHEMRRMRRGKQ